MAFKNDVADDMAPVWPRLAPRQAPHLAPRRAPRLAPRRAPVESKKKKNNNFLFLFFLVVFAGWKRGEKIFQFSVFNPQDPQDLQAPRASWAKPREEEGFFGLVPLVTHPSSIPPLGGLTPKFLSRSFHSL
jgi:hypothetical protein